MPESLRETRYLTSWGEVEWAALHDAATPLTCAWADYDGFHIGPCPTAPPPYTHIWGWNADGTTLMRGRIDGGRVVVGWLRCEPEEGEATPCVVRPMLTWRRQNQRLDIVFDGPSWPDQMTAVEVLGEHPVTFVAEWPR